MAGQLLRAALVALSLALVACGGSGASPTPTPEPAATPLGSGPAEQALARYVLQTLGKGFVEDCSETTAENDVGKICSSYRGEREGMRAYILGLTFSEGSQWAILTERSGEWRVVHAPALTPDNLGVPGVPWPLQTEVDLVVVGANDCVNVRVGPSLEQTAIDSVCDGSTVRLSDGPVAADGYEWWQLEGRSGWVVGDYLRYADAIEE